MKTNEKTILTKINDIEKLPTAFMKGGSTFFLRMDCDKLGKLRIGYICSSAHIYLISIVVDNKKDESTSNKVVKIHDVEFNQYEITTSTLEAAVNILYGLLPNELK